VVERGSCKPGRIALKLATTERSFSCQDYTRE
jgi:hypothetical protein